jgi:hypothetical protein
MQNARVNGGSLWKEMKKGVCGVRMQDGVFGTVDYYCALPYIIWDLNWK